MNEFKSKTNLNKLMQIQAKFFKPVFQELMGKRTIDDRMDQADFERKERLENADNWKRKENWEDWQEANQPNTEL